MDLESFRNDDASAEVIKTKCLNALNDIQWLDQLTFDETTTVKMAIEWARQGLDGGLEGTFKLQPSDLSFHCWVDYAHLCTILYNRNRTNQRYTILRNASNLHATVNSYKTENQSYDYGRIIPAPDIILSYRIYY